MNEIPLFATAGSVSSVKGKEPAGMLTSLLLALLVFVLVFVLSEELVLLLALEFGSYGLFLGSEHAVQAMSMASTRRSGISFFMMKVLRVLVFTMN